MLLKVQQNSSSLVQVTLPDYYLEYDLNNGDYTEFVKTWPGEFSIYVSGLISGRYFHTV